MSTLLWAAYVAAVGSLAALAAYVVEPVARALRWPTRWLWALALVAQLGAALVAFAAPADARPAAWFVGAWIVASCVAVAVYLRALRALRRERGEWRVTIAEEMPVWVSRETGPAVVGFLRSIVVAPGWAMMLARRERRLLLRHEGEHVAAWDPTLLLAALATCALVPWSPAAWWALARLRLAIEVDCDRRVLAAEPDVAAYGELLVAVQGRVVPGAAGLAAFAERRLPLEERIEAMTARRPRGAAWRWSARGMVAGALVLAACMAPRPTTTSLSGIVDIKADHLDVKRNADGTQTITARNATITARPDSLVPFMRNGSAPQDSSLHAGLSAAARSLDSILQSDSGRRTIDRLNDVLHGAARAEDAEARATYEQQRANALAFATLREHFHRADVKRPAAGHMALFVLGEDGAILQRRDVDIRDSVERLSISPLDLHLHFPDLPRRYRAYNSGVTSDDAFGLDSLSAVAWWMVGDPPAARPRQQRDDADSKAEMARHQQRAIDAARAYAARERLDERDAALTVRVLFASDWTVRGIVHGPYVPHMRVDSVLAAFPGARDSTWLRGGIMEARTDLRLPKGSQIAWAQLSPPRVIRVEPRKP